jgi:hypothetical protein
MRNISYVIALLFGVFVSESSFAQLSLLRDNGTGNPIMTNPYTEVKGSQYINEFRQGILYLANGQKVEGLQIALNGYENTLEYKLEGNLYSYSPENLPGFSIVSESGELEEFTSEYVIPTLSKKRFLKKLEAGKYGLYLYPFKIMTDDVGSTYGAQASKVFQNQENLFIVKDGKIVLFKTKTKDMQVIFGDDFEKANAIIKDQKLNLKNPEDVRVLIRQLN